MRSFPTSMPSRSGNKIPISVGGFIPKIAQAGAHYRDRLRQVTPPPRRRPVRSTRAALRRHEGLLPPPYANAGHQRPWRCAVGLPLA